MPFGKISAYVMTAKKLGSTRLVLILQIQLDTEVLCEVSALRLIWTLVQFRFKLER